MVGACGRGGWPEGLPRVDSFERNPDLVEELDHSLPSMCSFIRWRISDHSGDVEFWIPSRGMGTPKVAVLLQATATMDANWRQQEVATSRLDDFDLGDVGFVKIDVEGHQLAVLKGAPKAALTYSARRFSSRSKSIRPQRWAVRRRRRLSDPPFLPGLVSAQGAMAPDRRLGLPGGPRNGKPCGATRLRGRLYSYARRYIHNFVFRPV